MTQPINIDNATKEQEQELRDLFINFTVADIDAQHLCIVKMRDYLQENNFIVSPLMSCGNCWPDQVTSWVGWYINNWNERDRQEN